MAGNFDNIQSLGKHQIEAFTASSAALTKGWQGIAAEATDYSKKSLEKSRALAEKLVAVKKLDDAIALQTDFAKTSYDDFVAGATKLGELYTAMAKDAMKPFEAAAKGFKPAE